MASSLSDEELRRKLLEYGENFPVTDTNRRILLNKLKKLESGDRSRSRSSSRRSLLGFSSDESESEAQRPRGGTASSANGKTGSFAIDAVAGITSSASTISPLRRSRRSRTSILSIDNSPFSNDSSASTSFSQSRHSVRRNSASSTDKLATFDANETKSPFKVPLAANDRSSSAAATVTRRRSRISSSTSPSFTSKSKTVPQSHPKLDTSGSDSDISDSSISNIPENRGVNEFPRSRRSFVSTSNWSSPVTQSTNRRDGNHVDIGDYRRPTYYSSSSSAKLHANGHHDVLDTSSPLSSSGADYESSSSYGGADAHHNSQCISKFLVAVVVLFFVIVGLIYLGARHKDLVPSFGNEANYTALVSPVCMADSKEVSCVVANAAYHLRNILRHRAGEVECSNVLFENDRRMSFDEAQRNVETFLRSDGSIRMGDILRIYLNMTQWGVRLMNEKGDTVQKADLWQVYWLVSDVSELSLICRLKLAFRNTLYKASLLLASVIIFVVLGYVIYYYWDYKRREREEIFALVEKILDVLQNHNRACQNDSSAQPYLAIPHVRDMLIPPIERKSKRRIWDGAVRFIQNNESRVRFEVQVVEGEDFTVWRWLQADSPSTGGNSGNRSMRIWQGQAFEQLDSGINALPCSPTPCLKVRNMFDPDVEYEENWPVHIHDAILDKCIGADIVHLQVDSASREGCVYIKCKDSETAGKVYRLLHGWWFDGKLVTVKYLRVERYHGRFPEASRCIRYLRPIGTVVSSSSLSSSGHTMLRRSAISST